MKISKIETFPLRIPLAKSFTIASPSGQRRDHVDILVVRLTTDEGLTGVGETQAWRRQGSSEILLNLVRTIKEAFEPVLMGKNPFNISSIMQELNNSVYNSFYAQAPIGDALYDIVGKACKVPVYDLLGGKCRDTVEVSYPLSIVPSSNEMLEQAKWAFERGYRHFTVKIGLNPQADVANVQALREYFGSKVALGADANAGMVFSDALKLLHNLEDFDLDYVEQPVPLWDVAGLAELSRRTTIPISADESFSTEQSLIEIIKMRAASIVQTKVAKSGGIYYSHRLWIIAEAGGIAIFPGNHPGTSIASTSVAQLCAAWPYLRIIGDFPCGLDMLCSDVVKTPLEFANGVVRIPDKPGLGMELDEEKVALYRIKN